MYCIPSAEKIKWQELEHLRLIAHLSLSLFHSLPHLSGVSTWYQQGSHQVVRFLIGQMKTPRGSVPREQGGAFMPLFTLGLGSLSVPFVALFWWRQ